MCTCGRRSGTPSVRNIRAISGLRRTVTTTLVYTCSQPRSAAVRNLPSRRRLTPTAQIYHHPPALLQVPTPLHSSPPPNGCYHVASRNPVGGGSNRKWMLPNRKTLLRRAVWREALEYSVCCNFAKFSPTTTVGELFSCHIRHRQLHSAYARIDALRLPAACKEHFWGLCVCSPCPGCVMRFPSPLTTGPRADRVSVVS
jgi:hypothetical protein